MSNEQQYIKQDNFVLFYRGDDGRFSKQISLENLFPDAEVLRQEILFMQRHAAELHTQIQNINDKYMDGLSQSIQYYLFGIDWSFNAQFANEKDNIIALGSEMLKALSAIEHDLQFYNIDLNLEKKYIESLCAVYQQLKNKNMSSRTLTDFQLNMISDAIVRCIKAYNKNIENSLLQLNNQRTALYFVPVQNPYQFFYVNSRITEATYRIEQLNTMRILYSDNLIEE